MENLLGQFTDSDALAALAGGAIAILVFILLLGIAFLVVYLVAAVKLYQKAGKPGWAAIIPYYNTYVLTEIAGLNWWYFLIGIGGSILGFIISDESSAISNISYLTLGVFNFFAFYNIGKRFNKNPILYGVLAIFFSPIMVMILGFSKSNVYDESIAVSPNGPIGDSTNTASSNTPERYCLGCGKKVAPGVKFCENCGKEV